MLVVCFTRSSKNTADTGELLLDLGLSKTPYPLLVKAPSQFKGRRRLVKAGGNFSRRRGPPTQQAGSLLPLHLPCFERISQLCLRVLLKTS